MCIRLLLKLLMNGGLLRLPAGLSHKQIDQSGVSIPHHIGSRAIHSTDILIIRYEDRGCPLLVIIADTGITVFVPGGSSQHHEGAVKPKPINDLFDGCGV